MSRTTAILLILAGLVWPAGATPDITAQEPDVREATFRYQCAKNTSNRQERVDAYYLSIRVGESKDADPPEALMKRLAGNKPPVRKVSECIVSSDKGVVGRQNGRPGLIFNTGDLKWISPTQVEVPGGYHEGNMSASGHTYYLSIVDGKWKVIKDVLRWIG